MKHRAIVALALGILITWCASPLWAQGSDQQVRGLARGIQEKLAAAGKKTIAVVDFTDLDGSVTWLGRFLAEEVSVALASEAKGMEIIERTQLKAILQEQKLSSSGIIDPQTARKLGQIAGADVIVTGSLTPFGDSVRLSVKALDVNTARMIAASTTDIPKTKAIEELLARDVGGASPGGVIPKPVTPARPAGPGSIQTVVVSDVSFALETCSGSASSITCRMTVTNKAKDTGVSFGRSGAWDEHGIEYTISNVSLANRDGGGQLIGDIPTSLRITIVPADATGGIQPSRLSKLVLSFVIDRVGWLQAVFRDVPVSR